MKKLFLFLLLVPSLVFGATFTEFYCNQSTGSNLNAGSTTGGAAVYTSAGGNWVQSTRVFTPTDGSTPASSVAVGDFASVYVTAGAVTTGFVGRVTVVNSGVNGTITIDGTAKFGSSPANGSGTLTLKAGGTWKGPNVGDAFPLGNQGSMTGLTDSGGDPTRVNLKNNASYVITTAATYTTTTGLRYEGYSSSPGDGGRAKIENTNASNNVLFQFSTSFHTLINLEFATVATTGSSLVTFNSTAFVKGCVVHGARQSGISLAGGSGISQFVETEVYGCNTGNSAGQGGFFSNNAMSVQLYYCTIHDNTGSNTNGIISSSSAIFHIINCIVAGNGGDGINQTGSAGQWLILNNDFYNNTGDALQLLGGGDIIQNNNFIKNGGKALNITTATNTGILANNGYGAGTQANGSSDTLANYVETGKVTYPSNVTPWVDPANGDFRINLAEANWAGRGVFTETATSYAGAVGYPDIGAAQSKTGPGGTFSKETSAGYSH